MAIRTKTQFETLYGTTGTVFPDNTTGEISEADVRAFGQDIADSFALDSLKSATASGTDTYAATITGVVAYNTHDIYEIIFTNANTGSSTININGLGAKTLKKSVSTDLASGDILAGQSFIIVYDGTNFQVIGIGGGGGGTLTDGSGTTANGTAVDLGGTLNAYASIDGNGNGIDFINMDSGVYIQSTAGSITLEDDGGGGIAITDVGGGIQLTTDTGVFVDGAINEAQGANIASASTTDIGAATGNSLTVTGTTTITALGTVQAGTRRIVTFSGILILTHNGTSLILPTAANIITAAGDVAEFISLGSGNWKCTNYQRADGSSLSGSATAAGSDTYVQYNDSGSFGGEAAFTYDKTTNKLTVDNILLNGKTASRFVTTDSSKNLDTPYTFIDDDSMATASSTAVPSSESVKAYVDLSVAGSQSSYITNKISLYLFNSY